MSRFGQRTRPSTAISTWTQADSLTTYKSMTYEYLIIAGAGGGGKFTGGGGGALSSPPV